MESVNHLLITVDAGHGGYDNGASFEGRLEKNDNLNLALAVQKELLAQGVQVQMTRDTDVFVSLQDRARMANQADSDLFISLHRNSYTEQTPSSNGVENFIYLTAPQATAGHAAQLVLDEVVKVGVQSDRGVKRGNYYVLRKTEMPAMLLEMGYIINEIDNALFDEKLHQYAGAIARGAMGYFGATYRPDLSPYASEQQPPPGEQPGASAQVILNEAFGANLPVSGRFDPTTRRALVGALQQELNRGDGGANLAEDGIFGPETKAALPHLRQGARGNMVLLLQLLLLLHGYDPGAPDAIYGPKTRVAVQMYQRDHYLTPDGVAGPRTFSSMLAP